MKSDREFMDGIYNKVALYEKNIENNKENNYEKQTLFQKISKWQRSHRLQPILGASAVFFALFLLIGTNMRQNDTLEKNIDKMDNSSNTRNNLNSNTRTNNVSAYDMSEDYAITVEAIKTLGQITNMYEDTGVLYADIFINQSNDINLDNKTVTFSYSTQEISEDLFYIGEDLIVVLARDENDKYTLTNINENLYRFLEDNDGERVFISYSGKTLTEKNIME